MSRATQYRFMRKDLATMGTELPAEAESSDVIFIGFDESEAGMMRKALEDLEAAGYDTSLVKELIKAHLPGGGGMTVEADAIALDASAFRDLATLTHILEHELRHLNQKAEGRADAFGPDTADELEDEVDVNPKFPLPK